MDKKGLLVASPREGQQEKNIGDYIQSVAALQYSTVFDYYVHREEIANFVSHEHEKVKTILNAWWMWCPEKWPPSSDIVGLPISMHFNPSRFNTMIEKGHDWLKKNEPIGCRDLGTKKLLEEKGIKAYFSGCLTLTLGKMFEPIKESEKKGLCFVDPFVPRKGGIIDNLRIFIHSLTAIYTISVLASNEYFSEAYYFNRAIRMKNRLKVFRLAALFHLQYSKIFSDKELRESEYVHHLVRVGSNDDDNTLICKAKSLLQKYREKKLIVTSRIHCALPCLGIGTPVIFVNHKKLGGEGFNANRLKGLIDLFHSLNVSYYNLEFFDIPFHIPRIDSNTLLKNKSDWQLIASDLRNKCESFMNDEK